MSFGGIAAGLISRGRIRWTRWLLVAIHAAVILPVSVDAGIRMHQLVPWPPEWAGLVPALPLGLALLALQLRLSLSFAAGVRDWSWSLQFVAIAILVYVPVLWLGYFWTWTQVCLLASAPMVFRPRLAIAVIVAVVIGSSLIAANAEATHVVGSPIITIAWWLFYTTVLYSLPAAGMYGSARLVGVVDELRETRAEMVATAVSRERLRVARDLHDLLGQSLSGISLKGDLAIRLLDSNPSAARAEINSLAELARATVHGIGTVSRDEHMVSLREETEGATALLAAAGIQTRVDLDLPDVPAALEALLAWAVREGVANALRHSEARNCWITGRRKDGNIVLEIINDGVSGQTGQGSGLAGLAERAEALAGSVSATPTVDSEFRLIVKVPEEAA